MVNVWVLGDCERVTVFFRLIVSPKRSHASLKLFTKFWSCSGDDARRAASTAYSYSWTTNFWTLVRARNRAKLKKLPSSQESRDTPASTSKLACTVLKTYEKYMLKNVGASTLPCLTLFLIEKASSKWPSNWTL